MEFSEVYLISMVLLLLLGVFFYMLFKRGRFFIVLIAIFANLVYILWRIKTIPTKGVAVIFGLTLFVAEVLGTVQFLNFDYFSTKKYKIKKEILKNPYDDDLKTVDVLICTYNESVDLLKKTLIAALTLDYNKSKVKVSICDDGNREEVKALCKEYDTNYITRDNNKGAKAGNINNAFKNTNGEFVLILDADMIVKRNFLIKTIKYFDDEKMAFVQVPQSYYNTDMYQYNLKRNIPNEQDFFMRDIQEARASIDAILYVGTNAVFRREAVDAIGGFPTFSITEDMAVGMRLQAKGYKAILVNEPLALGLSATTLEEAVTQRERWARGNVQVFKRDNPILKRGLKARQKIAYIDGLLYWFSSIQKIIYIISPIIYLIFGILIINSSVRELLNFYVPYFSSQIVIIKVISPKNRNLKWSHYYETVMAPSISKAVLLELFSIKPIKKFNVTEKSFTTNKSNFQLKFAFPHIVLLTATIIAWFMCIKILYCSKSLVSLGYIILSLIWSIYNSVGLIVAIKVANQKPIFRSTERVAIKYKLVMKSKINNIDNEIIVKDLSDKGLAFEFVNNQDIKIKDNIIMCLNKTEIEGKIIRNKGKLYGVKFEPLNKKAMMNIMEIYIDNLEPYYKLKRDKKLAI